MSLIRPAYPAHFRPGCTLLNEAAFTPAVSQGYLTEERTLRGEASDINTGTPEITLFSHEQSTASTSAYRAKTTLQRSPESTVIERKIRDSDYFTPQSTPHQGRCSYGLLLMRSTWVVSSVFWPPYPGYSDCIIFLRKAKATLNGAATSR